MIRPRFTSERPSQLDCRPELPGAEAMGSNVVPLEPEARASAATPASRSIFVPEHYESNYAYPLIVWLQGPAGGEFELQRMMPLVSTRNYLGCAVKLDSLPSADAAGAEGWGRESLNEAAAQVADRVRELRRTWHVHSERIFLVGFGAAGTAALHLGLGRPEWFAGMAVLSGRFPATPQTLRRFRDLRGKRVLLAIGERDRTVTVAETVQTGRLLHAAGMRVTTRTYAAGHQMTRGMLTDIDRWVMEEICQPQPV